MYPLAEYAGRGYRMVHNHLFPSRKKLSSLMIYATDQCDSGCRHCLIWAKRPSVFLPFDTITRIMESRCVTRSTQVGLEGGEFLLHPEAGRIMAWFAKHHRNYDLFSNCLKPDELIESVKKYRPRRLYISLDGDRDTYLHMRGKDGYDRVLGVIEALKGVVPVFVMFTLSPYNDFKDLAHVADICRRNGVFLRVGIYNNIPFFDTIEEAGHLNFGEHKHEEVLTFSKARAMQEAKEVTFEQTHRSAVESQAAGELPADVIKALKTFGENYDYVKLYANWAGKRLRLGCHSILDSLIVLPDGDVPICQHLPERLGNICRTDLDTIFNAPISVKIQQHHVSNCNQCWVSYHRKYDIILYRSFEKYFGKWATTKLLGYYKWDADDRITYKDAVS